jgi:hypothetical protein
MSKVDTKYTALIKAVANWLRTAVDTPFVEVISVGWSLHPDQIGEKLEQLRGPCGAVVYYAGGDTNGGTGGVIDVDPGLCVAVVARGRSIEATSQGDEQDKGLDDLVEFVQQLHGKVGLSGMQNPVYFSRVDPFILPWRALTVSAVVLRFRSTLTWDESLS